ncbi:MAG: transcription termination factor NusA [bacterium]
MKIDFVQALRDVQKEKDIPFEILEQIIEDALVSAYRKHFGSTGELHVEIDWDTSSASVYTRKEVVDVVENSHVQMSLEEARKLDEEISVGELLDIEVTPEDFGRIAAQTAKQVVVQRIREAERDIIFDEFNRRAGEIVTGVVSRLENRTIFVSLGKVDSALLPPTEQMPTDHYRVGERIKVFVVEVAKTTKAPHVLLSRSHPGLLRKLFELEVPEIAEGVVEIMSIAREAGHRSKVAVYSTQEAVDPVGACVGHRGTRVQAVVDELRGEKIDIVRYSDDPARYLASALSPARISEVRLDEEKKSATVIVPDTQQSLAIGKEGQNVRLAARLTGWRIDIRNESQMKEQDEIDHPEFYGEGDEEATEQVAVVVEEQNGEGAEVVATPTVEETVEVVETAESAETAEDAVTPAESTDEKAE